MAAGAHLGHFPMSDRMKDSRAVLLAADIAALRNAGDLCGV